MNPIQKAIADAKFSIPLEILQEVFVRREFNTREWAGPVNIDAVIRDRVIEARVRPDCDLAGGQQVRIPLDSVVPHHVDNWMVVYNIPKSLTQNRSIARVMYLVYGQYAGGGVHTLGSPGYSQLLDATGGVMAAMSNIPVVQTANIRLIAENTVLCTEPTPLPQSMHLVCYLENDEDFSQLRSTTYHRFSRLVILAIKAHIYNVLAIPMGQGQLVGGMELGRFKEIVDSYADANELYGTYLSEEWRKVMILDGAESRTRHLRTLFARQ